jgi:hypothetical protein
MALFSLKKLLGKKVFDAKETFLYLVIFLVVSFFSGVFLYIGWNYTLAEQDAMIILELSQVPPKKRMLKDYKKSQERMNRDNIKAVYLTAYSAGNHKKITEIIDLINKTELNAVVIDTKDYSGKVLYDSDVPLVNELGLEDYRITKLEELIDVLHEYDIYVIARQTVFQDPILARKKPEFALKNKWGGLWYDYKGLAWVDPSNTDVWDYNVEIAKEAIKFGFDEVNFDYVRFPSDGNMSSIAYNNGEKKKYEVMADFFDYLDEHLSPASIKISLDMFGFVMEKYGEDDMSIGQRLEDALDEVDAIAPMMYPSHYPSGHLGLANPAAYPALVIENGMEKGAPRFENKRAKLRPWLQAFNLGAVYDANKIRAQIDMVEKYSSAGWMLWNAANRYTTAGLKLEESDKIVATNLLEKLLKID